MSYDMTYPKRIGFFGGSFDPPHNGHVGLVCAFMESLSLDVVYIVPAKKNPLKSTTKTDPDIRFELTRIAFQDVPKTKVLDCEISRETVSYTVDTVVGLIEEDPAFAQAERFLLIGDDLLAEVRQWKDVQKLFRLVKPVAGRRIAENSCLPTENVVVLDSSRLEISSTDIRQRIAKGLFCGHLVPGPVLAFIHAHKLYKDFSDVPGL